MRQIIALSLWLTLLLGTAHGQGYRVDAAGGPLTLDEELAAAAEEWRVAGATEELAEDVDADTVFRYADPQRMGPDAVSLTLQTSEEPGLEVLLHPQLYRDHPASLLHELGLVLGLPVADEGLMSPLLAADTPTEATASDMAALERLDGGLLGDIDGDGVVGLADLAALGKAYGERGVNLPADLDGDGVVGAGDIEVLRGAYRFMAPREATATPDHDEPVEPADPDETREPAEPDDSPEPAEPGPGTDDEGAAPEVGPSDDGETPGAGEGGAGQDDTDDEGEVD